MTLRPIHAFIKLNAFGPYICRTSSGSAVCDQPEAVAVLLCYVYIGGPARFPDDLRASQSFPEPTRVTAV